MLWKYLLNMAITEEVQAFLQDFKIKLDIWGIIYRDDRGKNAQTLLNLEISPSFRDKILKELQLSDYCEGPKVEQLYGGADMWVFGKKIKGQDVYIKISMGTTGRQVICISFHIAEYAMNYPLKK